jgi:PAS domain S-box-containing protein
VDPLNVINHTGAPAFATDEAGRITIWNKGAEDLLGYPASEVLGKSCHEILHGLDIFGNRFCNRPCALNCMVEHHETVHHFELDVRSESGDMIPASVSIVVLPGPRAKQHTLIHFLERVDRHREVSALIHRILTGDQVPAAMHPAIREPSPPSLSSSALTSREIQILRMLSDGTSTRDIAESLCISIPTTRNHIQNIFRKLDVHSKLEAVSFALRTHLF